LGPCQPSRLDADSDKTVSSPPSCSWIRACECPNLVSQTSEALHLLSSTG
jgi:hypothetical protein